MRLWAAGLERILLECLDHASKTDSQILGKKETFFQNGGRPRLGTDFWDNCGLIRKMSIRMTWKLEKPSIDVPLKLDGGECCWMNPIHEAETMR